MTLDEELHMDHIAYIQSQSMRNNLVFTNIPEITIQSNETMENKVLNDTLIKSANKLVDKKALRKVHRMGSNSGGNARIVAKFSVYIEIKVVRKQWKHLKGAPFTFTFWTIQDLRETTLT